MTSVNDLVSGVIVRVEGIPSGITGSPIIWDFINDARVDVQNFTGDSISSSSVPEQYQSILKNLGAAYLLSYMTGVGVDFDYSLGNFRVNKSSDQDANSRQINFFLAQANKSLNCIGRGNIAYKATNV